MTIDTLRGKTASLRRSWRGLPRPHLSALTGPKVARTPSYGIGDKDAHVFNCPVCARPLPDGTLQCPGCSTRLIFGVTLRRAGGLLAFGIVLGILVGGFAMSVAVGLKLPSGPAEGAAPGTTVNNGTDPIASLAPGASPATVATSDSLSAMRQMALLDDRMATDGATLRSAVKANRPADIARAIRTLGADAGVGAKYVAALRTWPDAAALATSREAFYAAVTSSAKSALTKSISNKKAYQSSGKAMLTVLRKVPKLDTAARKLAASSGVDLPVVDYSAID